MTTMMAVETPTDAADDYTGPRCQSCGGPCWFWKGSVWGFTCTACLEAYLDAGERAWQARPEKAKERITRNLLHGNASQFPVTANDRRRGGGAPSYVPTTAPASTDPTNRTD